MLVSKDKQGTFIIIILSGIWRIRDMLDIEYQIQKDLRVVQQFCYADDQRFALLSKSDFTMFRSHWDHVSTCIYSSRNCKKVDVKIKVLMEGGNQNQKMHQKSFQILSKTQCWGCKSVTQRSFALGWWNAQGLWWWGKACFCTRDTPSQTSLCMVYNFMQDDKEDVWGGEKEREKGREAWRKPRRCKTELVKNLH